MGKTDNENQDAHLTTEALNGFLDGFLDPDEIPFVERHLAACDACSARLAELQAVFAGLGALPEIALERDLSAAVLAAIQPPLRLPARLKWGMIAQAAITLVVSIIAAPFLLNSQWGQFIQAWIARLDLIAPQAWLGPALAWAQNLLALQLDWHAWLAALPQFPSLGLAQNTLWPLFLAAVLLFILGNGLLLRKLSGNTQPLTHDSRFETGG